MFSIFDHLISIRKIFWSSRQFGRSIYKMASNSSKIFRWLHDLNNDGNWMGHGPIQCAAI